MLITGAITRRTAGNWFTLYIYVNRQKSISLKWRNYAAIFTYNVQFVFLWQSVNHNQIAGSTTIPVKRLKYNYPIKQYQR